MNKKGFTMIELLAVIVILSTMVGLATASIIGIQKRINEKAYNALLDEIKVAAENYSIDTNNSAFFVEDLINEGRIEAEESGNLYDPRDRNNRLNCYVIETFFENGQYNTKIDDDSESHDLDDSCYGLPDTISLVYKKGDSVYLEFNTYEYEFIIECSVGLKFLFTNNKGYYESKTCTGTEEDNIKLTIANNKLPLTFTASFKSIDENIIKTRYVTITEEE